jgi:hypothetical protein
MAQPVKKSSPIHVLIITCLRFCGTAPKMVAVIPENPPDSVPAKTSCADSDVDMPAKNEFTLAESGAAKLKLTALLAGGPSTYGDKLKSVALLAGGV